MLLLAASVSLAACGSGSESNGGGTTAPRRETVDAAVRLVVRDAITALNRFDLPGFCRYFVPEAIRTASALQDVSTCDDARLVTHMSSCKGCEKEIQILSLTTDVSGDTAVAHLRLRPFPGAAEIVVKDVRLSRRSNGWRLLDSPEATAPVP